MNSECICSLVSDMALCAKPAMSGMTMTLETPCACSPEKMRRRMLDFSWFETTLP